MFPEGELFVCRVTAFHIARYPLPGRIFRGLPSPEISRACRLVRIFDGRD